MGQKCAILDFKRGETKLYKEFLQAMVGANIIILSSEEINKEVEEFRNSNILSWEIRVVLHDEGEVNNFKDIMSTFFKEILKDTRITDATTDETFRNYLERKEKRQAEVQNGDS